MRILYKALVISYPLVLHFFITIQRPDLAAIWIAALLAWPLVSRTFSGRFPNWSSLILALLSLCLLTVLRTHELAVFKLVPASIHLGLFLIFADSLRADRVPAITRIASLVRTDVSSKELHYTRQVTVIWSAFFLIMGLISVGLAVLASSETWSLFVNILSYPLVGLLFIIEYQVRRRVLGREVDYSFMTFVVRLSRINFRRVLASRLGE